MNPAQPQSFSRRDFLAVAGGAALAFPTARLLAADGAPAPKPTSDGSTKIFAPDAGPLGYKPVVTLNGATLPWKMVDGVKVFHLIAEPVLHEFAPGLVANCWGYNGRVHGPTIEGVEGDRVRIYVTNRLEAPTTVHWHGVLLPKGARTVRRGGGGQLSEGRHGELQKERGIGRALTKPATTHRFAHQHRPRRITVRHRVAW